MKIKLLIILILWNVCICAENSSSFLSKETNSISVLTWDDHYGNPEQCGVGLLLNNTNNDGEAYMLVLSSYENLFDRGKDIVFNWGVKAMSDIGKNTTVDFELLDRNFNVFGGGANSGNTCFYYLIKIDQNQFDNLVDFIPYYLGWDISGIIGAAGNGSRIIYNDGEQLNEERTVENPFYSTAHGGATGSHDFFAFEYCQFDIKDHQLGYPLLDVRDRLIGLFAGIQKIGTGIEYTKKMTDNLPCNRTYIYLFTKLSLFWKDGLRKYLDPSRMAPDYHNGMEWRPRDLIISSEIIKSLLNKQGKNIFVKSVSIEKGASFNINGEVTVIESPFIAKNGSSAVIKSRGRTSSFRTTAVSGECNSFADINAIHLVTHSLYPNPTTGLVNLTGFENVAKVELYSMSGQLAEVIKGVEDSFDISHLSDGMYIVRVYANNEIQTYRVILQK